MAKTVVLKLRQESNNKNIKVIELALARFASVRSFAGKVLAIALSIDVLPCNTEIQIPRGTQVTT